MFLQRGRLFHRKQQVLSPSSMNKSRLQQALLNVQIPEIKSHARSRPKGTERNILIHKTHVLFKNKSEKSQRHIQQALISGGRECRTAAARSVREKLSKPSDIASLMRVQERLSQSQLVPTQWRAGFQNVDRYQDLLREFSQSIKTEKKELLHSHYLTTPLRTSQRPRSSRNPEIQQNQLVGGVTNIEFLRGEESPGRGKTKRKETSRRNNFSYTSHGRRPLLKNNSSVHDQAYIEPW